MLLGGLEPSYCLNDPADVLIGSPGPGIFAGQGMNGGAFSPDQVGDSMVAYVQKNEASNELWVTRLAAESRVAVGQKLQFELSPDAIHLFDSESGKNLLKD